MQESLEKKSLVTKDSFQALDELMESIKERTGHPKIPTGIIDLDNLIWGVHRQELLIIAARPSQGKTSLLVQLAWNIAKNGAKVLFLSLEMSIHQILERIMCNEFLIHGFKLRQGDTTEMAKAVESADKMRSRLITSDLILMDSVGKTDYELRRIIEIVKPDVCFIDHVQRISAGNSRSKQEALAAYIQESKSLAMEHNVAMVVASQINRMGSDNTNSMDFLKGSGELEEAADTLIQLRWVGKDSVDEPLEKYKIYVTKQRHGPINDCYLSFDVGHYRLTNGDPSWQ